MNRSLPLLAFCLSLSLCPVFAAAERRPMKVDDLLAFARISDPQISPDGKWVAYVVGNVDKESNKIPASIWLAPADGKGQPRRLTNPPGKKDSHPRWSPDGKTILFQSNRSGESQLWVISLEGGEARQITTIATGASDAIWSRDGRQIAFVSAVYPEYSEKPFAESNALNKTRMTEIEKNPVKAKAFNRLFYRHWDEYVEDKRQHLFVVKFETAPGGAIAEPRDVTPGDRDAFPTSSTFSTGENFTFSPDGTYLVFTAVPEKDEAWSTDWEICRVPIAGATSKWECLTKENLAADSGPVFSPSGRLLAYRAQKKPGYEADKWDLMVMNVDESGAQKSPPRNLTSKVDSSIEELVWRNEGKILTRVDSKGSTLMTELPVSSPATSLTLFSAGQNSSFSYSVASDTVAMARSSLQQPADVFTIPMARHESSINVTHANDALLSDLALTSQGSATVKVEGADMQMWILTPPGFDPNKKWPLAFLVHGGPQSVWADGWSFRWNARLWASQGYVVALPNPRGSVGFGQKYADEVSGDWGGKCYRDLLAGLAYMESRPYIDTNRMAAAGGSFGGYMMNWFAVNTDKFKCLISHCSVWDFESMYATTDEVWFDEWEHGGPPWGGRHDSYQEFSPQSRAANLGKFKTPMLLYQNDLDFRCPIGQGQELFTALQRQHVPSRFINFPDEGHWVLKPKNSEYWHQEAFAWLTKYAPSGPK